jgi:aquaporin Z
MNIAKANWKLFLSEAIGVAVLLLVGLSFVIFNWGDGSIIAKQFPSPIFRTVLTGILFGTVGCLVTISPVGRISGAHINPAVSVAFWLRGKMNFVTLLGYVIAQMTGAVVGCVPLLLWGNLGKSIQYGITLPGPDGVWMAFLGEVFVTGSLILYLYIFIGSKKLRDFTPYGIPFLYGLLNLLEAPLSGDSTNPARSFGPAVIAGNFTHYWIYCLAPLTGTVIVTLIFRIRRINRLYRMEKARVSYHNSPTPAVLQTG